MQKHREIHHMRRSGTIQEFCQRISILHPSSFPCHPRHNVSVIDHTGLMQTPDSLICLSLVMILLHEGKHIVKSALYTQIQMPYSKLVERLKLGIRPFQDTGHRRIHINLFTFRKIPPDHFQYLHKPFCLLGECISVPQKNFPGIPSHFFHPCQFFLNLFKWKLPILKMPEQITEPAPVIGTPHHNRQHERGSLHRRTADLSFIFHHYTSLNTNLLIKALFTITLLHR